MADVSGRLSAFLWWWAIGIAVCEALSGELARTVCRWPWMATVYVAAGGGWTVCVGTKDVTNR